MVPFYTFIFFFIVTSFVFRIQRKRRAIERDFGHIPHPKALSRSLLLSKKSTSDAWELMEKLCPEPLNKLTFGGYLAFSTYDPETVRQILLSPGFLKRPYFFKFFDMENGLFSAYYKNWKPIRQSLNKPLNNMSVIKMADKLNYHSDQLVTKFDAVLGQKTFDLLNLCMRFGMEQIFDTMLDTKFSATVYDAHMIQELNEVCCARSFFFLYHIDWIFKLTKLHARAARWHEYLETLLKPIIKNKKNVREFNEESSQSFISTLLKMTYLEEKIDKKAMMDNLKTIILAGAEPLSISISNVLTMLAIHPEIDEKVYQEIQELYQEGTSLDVATLKKFSYLERVIQETNRLLTVVPGTVRDTLYDTNIDGIGLIPKGTKIFISASKMHRDPTIWGSDSNKFNPDHFLEEKVEARHAYSYLPFSGGARNCIGHHFAQISVKMALIKVLAKYKFTTEAKLEDLTFKFCLSMKTINKFGVQVHKR